MTTTDGVIFGSSNPLIHKHMLNGRELIDQGIITGSIDKENISQVGIDLNVIRIQSLIGKGFIPTTGKTKLVQYQDVPFETYEEKDLTWRLMPGAYNVEMRQGCNIPNNVTLLIRQRSSLLRNGSFLHSSVFDPGFKTDRIGTILIVVQPIVIEMGARICQIYGHYNTPVLEEDLYNGQFQNDKQRKQ